MNATRTVAATLEVAMKQRPLTKRKQAQLLVALTILAWATQTLLHQWAHGQDVTPELSQTPDLPAADKFVPGDADSTPAGTLELRQDATISGGDVLLKQVCRWSDSDAPIFTAIADLKVAHITDGTGTQDFTVDDLRGTLHNAGVNIAMINFSGATSCRVTRSDAQTDPQQTVAQWIDAQQSPAAAKPTPTLATSPADGKPDPSFHSLRDLLAQDLGQRLGIAPETLQLSFSPLDDKILALSEPVFKFEIRPSRARALGSVSWDVTICTDSSNKKISIAAYARAWENQTIVALPLAARQILSADDFTTNRVLVDALPDHSLLQVDQCAGQQAAQELRPGTVMTGQMVDPVPLVKPGQLVTVTLTRGNVQLRSVARAMEEGSLGQTVKVRIENTRETLDVTVTGPQEARLGDSVALAAN
jgi:flagella basal body P-ring formation protein FlgA